MGRMANIGDLKEGDLVRMTAKYPKMRREYGFGMVMAGSATDNWVKVYWFGSGTHNGFQSHCFVKELEIEGEER